MSLIEKAVVSLIGSERKEEWERGGESETAAEYSPSLLRKARVKT